MPPMVKDKQLQRFVYVLPKFVLGDNEKLLIEAKESKGDKSLNLQTKIN